MTPAFLLPYFTRFVLSKLGLLNMRYPLLLLFLMTIRSTIYISLMFTFSRTCTLVVSFTCVAVAIKYFVMCCSGIRTSIHYLILATPVKDDRYLQEMDFLGLCRPWLLSRTYLIDRYIYNMSAKSTDRERLHSFIIVDFVPNLQPGKRKKEESRT